MNIEKVTILNTDLYENSKEEEKILTQTKHPALALDLILEMRLQKAIQDEKLSSQEKRKVKDIMNKKFNEDEITLPEAKRKQIEKIKRKLRKGEPVRKYPNLKEYF